MNVNWKLWARLGTGAFVFLVASVVVRATDPVTEDCRLRDISDPAKPIYNGTGTPGCATLSYGCYVPYNGTRTCEDLDPVVGSFRCECTTWYVEPGN